MSTRAPRYWAVVGALLTAAWRRAAGRRRRAQQLLSHRAGKRAGNWGIGGFMLVILMTLIMNGAAAWAVIGAVQAGERYESERGGVMVVDDWFMDRVGREERRFAASLAERTNVERRMDQVYADEARSIILRSGGDAALVEAQLRQAVATGGTHNLADADTAAPGLAALPTAGGMAALLGSLVVLVWSVMLMLQGEGLEMNVQRRRHPMWEWLFSHPVPASAVFLAEMLAPIAANPVYLTAPLFPAILYGFAYDSIGAGLLGALLVGVPLSAALACLGKALEIAVTLRVSPRSRGAVTGLMSWLGYALMLGFLMSFSIQQRLFAALAQLLAPFAAVDGFPLRLLLGAQAGGFSLLRGVAASWVLAALIIAGSAWFSVWGAGRGLSGNDLAAIGGPSASASRSASAFGFGKRALYRKEMLWFMRDRSALVQAVLIPLTLGGYQLFNMRLMLARAGGSWSGLCGAAVLFGSYFLFVLGPKSLAAEGAALWMTLTWPHGLEQLLKAKAWLWAILASAVVVPVLCAAAVLHPWDSWKVALVGLAWVWFVRSMAAKTVTLATTTSDSGEVTKVPAGRRWAATLGMLPFVIGIFTQQWTIALTGLLYSVMTATAMWQNFRARLPFLYDPWSETLPPAPTLMHAMIAISCLVELAAVVTAALMAIAGRQAALSAHSVVYGFCAITVAGFLLNFLHGRGVRPADIWLWRASFDRAGNAIRAPAASLALGAVTGLILGAGGLGYTFLLQHIPSIGHAAEQSAVPIAGLPHLRLSLLAAAVLVAPIAEEFLFRGLLYRALDREWGGWRAIAGSAAFFASYHPFVAWLPVGLLGATNALLFKKTGRLAPCILAHMAYNAVVLHALL